MQEPLGSGLGGASEAHLLWSQWMCVDTLAKRGTHQRNLLSVYSNYPSFVNLYYVRDLAGLGVTKLCAQGSDVGDV